MALRNNGRNSSRQGRHSASYYDGRSVGSHSAGQRGAQRRKQPVSYASHSLQPNAYGADRRTHRRTHAKQGGATLAEVVKSKSKRKMLMIGLGILIAIALISGGIGVYVYFKTTNANLALDPSNARDALVQVNTGDPFYVLCAAEMDNPKTKAIEDESTGYMLVRVDDTSKTLTFLTIPCDTQASMSDGAQHALTEAVSIGGDAELISAVSNLLDIKVNHFIYTNSDHLKAMVDLLGGVQMDVVEEIDDPRAGTQVIYAGNSTLTPDQALVLLRATNVSDGFDGVARNRVDFTLSLLQEAFDSNTLGFASIVGDASKYVNTDIPATDLLAIGDKLKPLDSTTIYSSVLPTYESLDSSNGVLNTYLYKSQWAEMSKLYKEGQDPNMIDSAADSVNPADVSVEVRNGTQMVGAAAKLGEILEQFGYTVNGVGNTDDGTIYPETLIIYTDPIYEGAAKAIARDIGCGRVVNGGDFYSSQANVIAIIGADYMPAI